MTLKVLPLVSRRMKMVFIKIKKLRKEQIWENVLGEITHSI